MTMDKLTTLANWARKRFDPPPSMHTLRQMVRNGEIYPPPVKIGREWRLRESARLLSEPADITDRL